MAYLHKCNILHRDIQLKNFLVMHNASTGDISVKVCDLGISQLEGDTAILLRGATRLYSPEAAASKAPGSYTKAADVFMFGMNLWMLMECTNTFPGLSTAEAVTKIRNGERPAITKQCKTNFWQLIQLCWDQDPSKRPSFEEIVKYVKSMKEG